MVELVVIILAAGEGKRMCSDIPKVLHLFGEKPMLVKVIEAVKGINPDKIIIVTGRHKYRIINEIDKYMDSFDISFVEQSIPNGTGNAILCCEKNYSINDNVLILNGDMPLITAKLLNNICNYNNNDEQDGLVLTTIMDNPIGYGRIIYNNNMFEAIIEEKDCTEKQRLIKEVNAGIYLFKGGVLLDCIPRITNENKQHEYYLTDIIKLSGKYLIKTFLTQDNQEVMGVNTPTELISTFEIFSNYNKM